MFSFQTFIQELGPLKTSEIPFYYKNQFKIKENFINPNSKHFDSIAQKLLAEEKPGVKRKWDKQCKMLFIWILVKFFQMRGKKTINPNKEEWILLTQALNIEEITLKQRWITLINPMTKSISWELEEDDIIRKLMSQQEEKHIWTQIALELYNHNNGQFVRTPKQVRERWMNYLNPKLRKDNWTHEEDLVLLGMVVKHGKRWSHISSLLEGRTENHVKNRFKSLIHKIYKDEDDDDVEEIQAIREYLTKETGQFNQNIDISEPMIPEKVQDLQVNGKQRSKYERSAKSKVEKADISEQSQGQQKYRKKCKIIQQQINVKIEDSKQQLPSQFENLQQLPQQHTSGTCDTRSLENRKDLSTPISLASFFQQQNDIKNEQIKQQFFNRTQLQQQQQQIISPLYNQNTSRQDLFKDMQYYQGFRPYNNNEYNNEVQQTPIQLNPLTVGSQLKKNANSYPSYQQNIVSPFQQQVAQTPLVYTPMYYFNTPYYPPSPQIMLRSPYGEASPLLQQQYQQWINQQANQQQLEMEIKNEQQQQQQESENLKLEFLQKSNLVDIWKQKRDSLKQNRVQQEQQ